MLLGSFEARMKSLIRALPIEQHTACHIQVTNDDLIRTFHPAWPGAGGAPTPDDRRDWHPMRARAANGSKSHATCPHVTRLRACF